MLNRRRFITDQEMQHPHLPPRGALRKRMRHLFLMMCALLLTHVTGMMLLEKLSLGDALWLSFTTLATVGYGDLAPATGSGRFLTVVLMYMLGITLLTVIVSDYIEYRYYRRERLRTGRWRYHLKHHLIIINTPLHGGTRYFQRLAAQLRTDPTYQHTQIMLLTTQFPNGLPPELQELGVVHYHGSGDDPEALKAVSIADARHIVVLARDESEASSDSYTFDILHRLHEYGLAQHAVAECVRDDNRYRMQHLGVGAVIRPVRTYPEIMVRTLVAPGSEKVLEDLFDHENDHPHRYSVQISGLSWSDVVCALIRAGLGTAMAYVDPDGEVICHPNADDKIEGRGLIVLVKSDNTPSQTQVEQALEHYRGFIERWHAMQEKAGLA